MTLNGGTITKTNETLTLTGLGSFSIGDQITSNESNSAFNSDLVVNGTTVTLTNPGNGALTANNYTGPTSVIGGGTLINGSGVDNVLPSGTVLTLGANTDSSVTNTYDLGGNNQTIGALTSGSSSPNINLVTNNGAAAATLTLSGTNSDGTNVNSNFAGMIQDGSPTATTALAVNAPNTVTVTLSGANTYSGGTTLTAGILYINNGGTASASAIGTGTFAINGGTIDSTVSGVTVETNNALTLGGSFTFGGTNNLNLGTGAVSNTVNPTVQLNGTGTTLTLGGVMTNNYAGGAQTTTVNGAGNTLVLGGYVLSNSSTNYTDVIAGSGNVTITGAVTNGLSSSSGLTYNGTGTLTLSGANTYSGATTISSGTVQAGVVSVAGVSGALGLNSAVSLANTAGATLALNSFSTQIGSLSGGGAAGGNVTLGSATLTDVQTTPTSFAGMISGGGGLTLNGPGGTLTLTGANSYSGATSVVNSGTLALSNNSGAVLGATAVTVGNGTLLINGTNTIGTSSGGSLTLSSGASQGTLTFSSSESTPSTLLLANSTSGATVLTIGTASTSAILNFNLGSNAADRIDALQNVAVGAAGATVNINVLTGATVMPGTYPLILDAALTTGSSYTNLTLGTISGYSGTDRFSLSQTGSGSSATAENLVVQIVTANPTAAYWGGSQSAVWNTINNPNTTADTNWLTAATGGTDTHQIPGPTTDVYETANGGTTTAQTLGQVFTINSLTFNSNNAPGGTTISPDGNMLTINAAAGATRRAPASWC